MHRKAKKVSIFAFCYRGKKLSRLGQWNANVIHATTIFKKKRKETFTLFIFLCSKHAKRHPNFNTNALRQRRLTLPNHVTVVSANPTTLENPKKLNKADSVNSSEDNSTGASSEEPQYSDKMSDSLPSP